MRSALSKIPATDAGAMEEITKKSIREGEEGLLLAMLEIATEDFQKYVLPKNKEEKALFDDAEEWILTTKSRWFFSFENVCRHLQLDPDYLRRGFMAWKAAKLNGHAQQCPETAILTVPQQDLLSALTKGSQFS